MIAANQVEPAERVWNEAMEWSSTKEDRRMQGWLLFSGSRLDFRRQDLYRARDRANDALKIYTSLEDKLKIAELQNHLAMIANWPMENQKRRLHPQMQRKPPSTWPWSKPMPNTCVDWSPSATVEPSKNAIEHFRKANEIAGSVGQGPPGARSRSAAR